MRPCPCAAALCKLCKLCKPTGPYQWFVCCHCLCSAAAAADTPAATQQQQQPAAPGLRQPLDNTFIWQLIWQQRGSIFTALAALLFCVGSNLASPVLSGVLFETLVQGQPFSKWVAQRTAWDHLMAALHAGAGHAARPSGNAQCGQQSVGGVLPVQANAGQQAVTACLFMVSMSPPLSHHRHPHHSTHIRPRRYSRVLAVMMVLYVTEPLLSQVYIQKACEAGEKVQAALRLEAFRTLLMQRIEFFDRHRCGAGRGSE